jgi:cbb3-type cytochrome oxidase maturation protein
MNEATIALTVMTFLLFLIFLGLFIWGIKTGQFRNVEEPKYRMFSHDEHDKDQEKEEQRKGGNDS